MNRLVAVCVRQHQAPSRHETNGWVRETLGVRFRSGTAAEAGAVRRAGGTEAASSVLDG